MKTEVIEGIRKEEQKRILNYFKSLLKVNPKASLKPPLI